MMRRARPIIETFDYCQEYVSQRIGGVSDLRVFDKNDISILIGSLSEKFEIKIDKKNSRKLIGYGKFKKKIWIPFTQDIEGSRKVLLGYDLIDKEKELKIEMEDYVDEPNIKQGDDTIIGKRNTIYYGVKGRTEFNGSSVQSRYRVKDVDFLLKEVIYGYFGWLNFLAK